MANNKKKKWILILPILIILILLLFKENEERFAKLRLYSIDSIEITCNNNKHNIRITDDESIKELRKLLYGINTKGHWYQTEDGPGWDTLYTININYADGYVEKIECGSLSRVYKLLRFPSNKSYSTANSPELLEYCDKLFLN